MGLATQMIHWDEDFCALLGERGYRVIRFDNRDIGHSTKLDSAGVPGPAPMMLGYGTPAYRLRRHGRRHGRACSTTSGSSAAHVVGASMGGMIAQQLAIDHPERALSLCSIMSTTGNRRYRFPRWRAFAPLMAKPPRRRDGYVEQAVKTFKVIGSPAYPMDEARFRELVGRAYDRSFHPPGVARQLHAINCSGNRTARAARGSTCRPWSSTARADPLVRPVGGRRDDRAGDPRRAPAT